MHIIVADSSPLIGLARIERLELLRKLASRVLVPPAVWAEVTQTRAHAPGAALVASQDWIEVVAPESALAATMRLVVDNGEAEAIALAHATKGSN